MTEDIFEDIPVNSESYSPDINELAIVITLPAKIEWSDYEKELLAAASGETLNFKVSHFPTDVSVGSKCYLVHRGYIRGWMTISGFSTKRFQCTTTGKWFDGKFIERTGAFHYLDEKLPMNGFQGFRYFSLSEYKKQMHIDDLNESAGIDDDFHKCCYCCHYIMKDNSESFCRKHNVRVHPSSFCKTDYEFQ